MAILGTRGSDLALWQARTVQSLLRERAGLEASIRVIRTAGDRQRNVRLTDLPGQGFFTKEIEEALLRGEIDLAVHSLKDLPTRLAPGLAVAAVCERGSVADCLLVHPRAWVEKEPFPLRTGAVVGTGSARRTAQLKALRPDLVVRDLRGNVPTRLRRAVAGEYDAILLAQAGIDRLRLNSDPLQRRELPPERFVPAPGQGALAVQVRAKDEELSQAVRTLHHDPTARLVAAERGLLALFQGGCRLPLGAFARGEGGGIHLVAVLGRDDGVLRRCEVTAVEPGVVAREAFAQLTLQPG
jgi:hydroxymethylbilane synthase